MSKNKSLSLYIHWPFCKAKCPYCDFNSHVLAQVDEARFVAALQAEMRYMAALIGPRVLRSVFFGGGTPSLMAPRSVAALLEEAAKLWRVEPDCEITLEANPTSVEAGRFRGYRAAGVKRVSIGVQSLRGSDLKALGRMHSVDEAKQAVKLADKVFERFSFDLIYAREGQKIADWKDELAEALNMAGGHLSVYQLTMEPGTQFYTMYQSGRLVLPDDDMAADFYDITQDMCEAAGLPAYEVSNHAAVGQASRHNLAYWHYDEYVGIGAGAHGRVDIDGVRHATRARRAPQVWLEHVLCDGHGMHPFEALDAATMFEEKLMMGLRLKEGLALQDQERAQVNAARLKVFKAEGLLEDVPDRLVPTRKGRLVLTGLSAGLLAGAA